MSKVENAKKLVAQCSKSLQENEYNMRKVCGVSMSYSDIETAILYGETIIQCGTYAGQLIQSRGKVADLLGKYGLLENASSRLV